MTGSFYTNIIQKSNEFNSTNRITDLGLLFPPFLAKVMKVLDALAAAGHTAKVFETYRSEPRQQLLFKQRATKLKTVGVHHYGLACDIVFWIAGEPSWKADYSILAKIATQEGLISGANWGHLKSPSGDFHDMDHVQYINVSDQNKLFNDSWYPDKDYKPVYD